MIVVPTRKVEPPVLVSSREDLFFCQACEEAKPTVALFLFWLSLVLAGGAPLHGFYRNGRKR